MVIAILKNARRFIVQSHLGFMSNTCLETREWPSLWRCRLKRSFHPAHITQPTRKST